MNIYRNSALTLFVLTLAFLLSACGGKGGDMPAPSAALENTPAQETQQQVPTQTPSGSPSAPSEPASEPEPTVEPMKEFVLGGSLDWEDEEIIKNTMAQYKGRYQNSDSKRLYIDGSDFTYCVKPPKIGGFEGDMEVHTFNDGDDVFTNKFLVEGDSRLTIECEGRAGHYAEGVVITFVFEDGIITVTCGDETMTFTQGDKQ